MAKAKAKKTSKKTTVNTMGWSSLLPDPKFLSACKKLKAGK